MLLSRHSLSTKAFHLFAFGRLEKPFSLYDLEIGQDKTQSQNDVTHVCWTTMHSSNADRKFILPSAIKKSPALISGSR
jgi:hypothetical protein